ncbi:MAG: hypothetical protein AAFX06_28770, partial [Planctomycetota bacterium]
TSGDGDQSVYKGISYTTIESTVAIRGTRRPEYRIPAELQDEETPEVKTFTIEHPSLELVHIAADTVVDLDADNAPVTSAGGILRNPLGNLQALAEIIASHVLDARYSATVQTGRLFAGLYPGDFLASVDTFEEAINAPIRELRIDLPITPNGQAPKPAQTRITAAAYQLNINEFL